MQKHFEAKGAGHYGIFSGKRWREHVYPHVKSFILANQPAETANQETAMAPAVASKSTTRPVKAEAIQAAAPANKAQIATKTIAPKATTRKK